MRRIAIIDIGSNSVRLILSEINSCGYFKILDSLKESVRLGADMIDNIKLNDQRIEKAVSTLKNFKQYCDAVKVDEIIAIATEAVRKAANRDYFIKKAKEETEISIRVLSGDEEIFYDYLGIVKSMETNNALMVDIGGSSTELAWIQNGQLKKSAIFPFGAVNLTQKFNTEDIVTPKQEDSLRDFLSESFKKIPWLFETEFDSIIGIGGTFRNIGKINRLNNRYALDLHHNYELLDIDLNNIYNLTKSKSLKQRRKIEGLSLDRADIIVAPVCTIYMLTKLLNINKIIVSGKGLREGLIYEYIEKNYGAIGDILDFSLNNVISNHAIDITHANNVNKLTGILFDKLQCLHHIDSYYKRIVKTAALLHDSGLSIRYYDHHQHSFYMILNSSIYGLSHKEIVISAYAAAYHENNLKTGNFFLYYGIINRIDIQIAEKIGCLLRIAECLDKSMSGDVYDIDCKVEKDNVILTILSYKKVDLEIDAARKCTDIFYNIYEKNLIIN